MVALVESMQYGLFAGLINFITGTLHISIEQLGLNLALADRRAGGAVLEFLLESLHHV